MIVFTSNHPWECWFPRIGAKHKEAIQRRLFQVARAYKDSTEIECAPGFYWLATLYLSSNVMRLKVSKTSKLQLQTRPTFTAIALPVFEGDTHTLSLSHTHTHTCVCVCVRERECVCEWVARHPVPVFERDEAKSLENFKTSTPNAANIYRNRSTFLRT